MTSLKHHWKRLLACLIHRCRHNYRYYRWRSCESRKVKESSILYFIFYIAICKFFWGSWVKNDTRVIHLLHLTHKSDGTLSGDEKEKLSPAFQGHGKVVLEVLTATTYVWCYNAFLIKTFMIQKSKQTSFKFWTAYPVTGPVMLWNSHRVHSIMAEPVATDTFWVLLGRKSIVWFNYTVLWTLLYNVALQETNSGLQWTAKCKKLVCEFGSRM